MAIRLSKSTQRWGVVVVGLAILAAVGPLIVGPITERIRFSLMPDRERDESSGIVRVFRGLQFSLADICYARSVHYQHRGILYQFVDEDILSEEISEEQSHLAEGTETTTASAAGASKAGGAHVHQADEIKPTSGTAEAHEHVHKDITIIPARERDFRGLIGDVEREVKPFDLTHVKHTEPMEALPWLRLATWINPEHENAWVATAFWLKGTGRQNRPATSQAIALLERAVALNPPRKGQPYDKHGLIYMLGHLYLVEGSNPRKALEILEPFLKRGEEDFSQLNEVQRDWLSYSFRDAAQACRKLGQHEKAVEICRRGIVLFPDDGPLQDSLAREQLWLKKAREKKPAKSK